MTDNDVDELQLSGTSSENDSGDWNFVNYPHSERTSFPGTSTPIIDSDSSCEYVNVPPYNPLKPINRSVDEIVPVDTTETIDTTDTVDTTGGAVDSDASSAEVKEEQANVTGAEGVQAAGTSVDGTLIGGATVSEPEESNKDKELRHLMEILQDRVKSGADLNISSDADFIQLPHSDEQESEDLMAGSAGSSVGSRFNIIVQRDPHPYDSSEEEDEDYVRVGEVDEDAVPDADDRVECDIAVLRPEVNEEGETEEEQVRPVRHYRHSRNSSANSILTVMFLMAVGFSIGIGSGHWIGSAREAHLQREIQEGQKLRLRSIQDDLLMCLRKQEDIDQTITKLNEIENILVDAEHWRNEYEELLNIKLQNEEKLGLERARLQKTLSDLEKSHDRLVKSKSCSHDSEFLSRQEITLKSVHEKLEASLSDKDPLIERLQTRVTDLKVNLQTAEKMAQVYKASNEDKSMMILGLKEQLLQMEREIFDMKINGDSVEQKMNVETAEPAADLNLQKSMDVVGSADNASSSTLPGIDAAELLQLRDGLNTCQSQLSHIQAIQKSNEAVPVLADTAANEAPVSNNNKSAIQGYEANIRRLQLEVLTLQMKIRNTTAEASRNATSSTTTDAPCVVFNMCDQLRLNITSTQVLRLYEATRGQYRDLQAFLKAEWRNIVDSVIPDQRGRKRDSPQDTASAQAKDSAPPKSEKSRWGSYVSDTKSTMSEFLTKVNDTWAELKRLSQNVTGSEDVEKETGRLHKKINKKLKNVASTIKKGLDVVKQTLLNTFDSYAGSAGTWGETRRSHEDNYRYSSHLANDESDRESPPQFKRKAKSANHISRKYQKSLEELTAYLRSLDGNRATKLKSSEKKDIYERLADFDENSPYMFANSDFDVEPYRMWISCQTMWWRRSVGGSGVFDVSGCAAQLMSWQAEEGHKQKLRSSSASPAEESVSTGVRNRKFEMRLEGLRAELRRLNARLVNQMESYEQEDIAALFDDFYEDYSYMFSNPDHGPVRSWVECQCAWWKQKVRDFALPEYECDLHLMPWQLVEDVPRQETPPMGMEDEADGSWLYERAKMREERREEAHEDDAYIDIDDSFYDPYMEELEKRVYT